MSLIDRYILKRFTINYLVLFGLLFLFAGAIDVIVNLDEFSKVATLRLGEDATTLQRLVVMVKLMISFQTPRSFVFFAYMHGMLGIGAGAFTLAQMHRQHELVAILASGVSLHRLAVPFMLAMFVVSLIQLANQEMVLYRVAPLVIRSYSEAGQRSVDEFPVNFTETRERHLLQAAAFEPGTSTLHHLTVLERDDAGRTYRRVTADEAVWNTEVMGWDLTEGLAITLPRPGDEINAQGAMSLDFYSTDVSPAVLTGRRYGQYIAMLNLRQIDQLLETTHREDTRSLLRHRYARFATIFVNLLVLAISLPSFLLREPASLMRQTLMCASMALPAMIGAAVGMTVELGDIPPAAGAFLPVALLIPLAMARWTFLKT